MVLPREHFRGFDGFVPWTEAEKLLDSADDWVGWMLRAEAECSEQWIQPIPCAIFRDSNGHYCIFRQTRHQRTDLSLRFSFIIGGHIDRSCDSKSVRGVYEETARREVAEEVGVELDCLLKQVGIVIDSSSMNASRHIGIVYEATVDRAIKSTATEEFSVGSKYNGKFFSIESLCQFRSKFDPWSSILFSQYLGGGFSMDIGRQPTLFLPTE